MEETPTTSLERKLVGSASVVGAATRGAAALVGVLPVIYLYSWQRSKGYYAMVRAGWLLSLLPTSAVLAPCAGSLLTAVACFLVTILWGVQELPTPQSAPSVASRGLLHMSFLYFVAYSPLIGSGLCLISEFLKWVGARHILAHLGESIFLNGLAIILAVVVAGVRERVAILTPSFVALLALAFIYASDMVPSSVGQADALLDLSPSSTLPLVTFPDAERGERLLFATDSRFYVLAGDSSASPAIYVRESTDARVLRPTP